MITRVFTKDVGRFRKGEVREYPRATWDGIMRSAKAKSYDEFSKLVTMLETQIPVKPAA
jgi:hypothetical protein